MTERTGASEAFEVWWYDYRVKNGLGDHTAKAQVALDAFSAGVKAERGSRGEAERDGERWLFLMRHWNSMYKGKPLHRYMDEESLRLGGMEACLDEAMAAAHASRLLQPERATSEQNQSQQKGDLP